MHEHLDDRPSRWVTWIRGARDADAPSEPRGAAAGARPARRRRSARSRSRPASRGRRAGFSVTLEGLRAFYGDAEQVKGIDLEFQRQRGDRDHRALGLRQVDDGPLHQPHARGDPRRSRRGPGAARGPRRLRPLGRRRRGPPGDRHGLPEAQPLPDDVDLRQRRRRPAAELAQARQDLRAKVEAALRGAGLWDEVSGPPRRAGSRALRRPAAAAVHRPLARGRPRGDPDGRALLGARPDRDAEDRGADRASSSSG